MLKNLAKNGMINKIFTGIVALFCICCDDTKRKTIKNGIKFIFRNEKKKILAKLIKEKYSDCWCIFPANGIGDIFFIAGLVKEFKKRNTGKVVFFTWSKKTIDFLKAFPSVDEIIFDKNISFLKYEHSLQKQFKKGELNRIFYPYRGGKKSYVFCDNYNNFFNLPLDVEREIPIIKEQNYKNAETEFKRLKIIKEKTILIIPDSVMFDYRTVDCAFWKTLAEQLEEKGFSVVFNTKSKKYKNFRNTFLPLMDFIALAKQSKHIISFRSGISDFLVGMNIVNHTAIYPQNLDVFWTPDGFNFDNIHKNYTFKFDTEFENVFNVYSLNAIFKRKDIHEIIYNYDDDNIIKQIVERIE